MAPLLALIGGFAVWVVLANISIAIYQTMGGGLGSEIFVVLSNIVSLIGGFAAGLYINLAVRKSRDAAETARRSRQHEVAEQERRRAHEAELIDLRLLDAELERLSSTAKPVSSGYLYEVAYRTFAGDAEKADEFERREYPNARAERVEKIKNTALIFESSISFRLHEYDFDKKRFPARVFFEPIRQGHYLSFSRKDKFVRELEAYITMENLGAAKQFRRSEPKVEKATAIVRPIHVNDRELRCELLALRLLDGKRVGAFSLLHGN